MPRPVKGQRFGGRQKGTPNRDKSLAKTTKLGDMLPLEYMLGVMRNKKNSLSVRMDAAIRSAPYLHAKLASTVSAINITGKLTMEMLVNASYETAIESAKREAEPQIEDAEYLDAAE